MTIIDEAELNPWLILLDEGTQTRLALWRIADHGDESGLEKESAQENAALAIFSDVEQAKQYADKHCPPGARAIQFDESQLIRVMASSFQNGIRYAALNPAESTARQLFVLRDVLRSAKERLKSRQTH